MWVALLEMQILDWSACMQLDELSREKTDIKIRLYPHTSFLSC